MKSRRLLIHALLIASLLLSGCEKMLMDDLETTDAIDNFEYLWQRVDRQYALFDVKNVDWQTVHDTLLPKVHTGMSREALFAVLADMLNQLNDGHVNLIAPFDACRSDSVFLRRYQRKNIDERTVALHYLTAGYHVTGSLQHNAIADSDVVYIRYNSFENDMDVSHLRYIALRYRNAKGMIIDLRQNGGGRITYVWEFLKLMPGNGQILYTTQIKNGPAHNAFSTTATVKAPSCNYPPYTRPVAVLVDRGTYSAASLMAISTMAYSNMFLMGDTTGGGLGMPGGGELPNGWRYRFSVTRTLATDGKNYENGIPPDYHVMLSADAVAAGHDNVIDSAVSVIRLKSDLL